jgi:hypothetical protein
MKYKYHAKCSQCGLGFRSNLRSDLLRRLRKHLWSKHRAWMIGRIKAGLRKRKKELSLTAGNPFNLLRPSFVGFAERPLIEALTGRPYEEVRQAFLNAMTSTVGTGVSFPLTKKK